MWLYEPTLRISLPVRLTSHRQTGSTVIDGHRITEVMRLRLKARRSAAPGAGTATGPGPADTQAPQPQ